jgi:dTDP-4-dehydrorhamnose reductase
MDETKTKFLITGGNGTLGNELVKIFSGSLHPSHKELDLTDKKAVFNFIEKERPEVVIHCAALTGIRECEQNQKAAWMTNVEGTRNIVEGLEKNGSSYFVYLSTACVFRGDVGNYVETDIPYPKNFYALTKLLGEFEVKYSNLRKWLIIRTNFVGREKWPYEKAFVDRYGTYLFADDLASAMASLIKNDLGGIVHVCGEEKISMFELAKINTPHIEPMTLDEYVGPPLTVDMSLRSERISPFKIRK